MATQSVLTIQLLHLRHTAYLLRHFLTEECPGIPASTCVEGLARVPQVHLFYRSTYFDFFAPLAGLLSRYAELKMQSAYSGAYTDRVQNHINIVREWIQTFENDSSLRTAIVAFWSAEPPKEDPVPSPHPSVNTDVHEDVDIHIDI